MEEASNEEKAENGTAGHHSEEDTSPESKKNYDDDDPKANGKDQPDMENSEHVSNPVHSLKQGEEEVGTAELGRNEYKTLIDGLRCELYLGQSCHRQLIMAERMAWKWWI